MALAPLSLILLLLIKYNQVKSINLSSKSNIIVLEIEIILLKVSFNINYSKSSVKAVRCLRYFNESEMALAPISLIILFLNKLQSS